ncbi:MAG: PD-(D/E)XK nuclease family protein, partial [Holosporaceae bacterium]|nr:PD-(D/E)XK nuclease family protein [Holosporaceae bacterium]
SEKTNDSKSFSQWLDICCQLASEINQESIDRFQEFSPYSDWSLEITLAEFAVFIKNYVLAQPLRTVDGYTPNVLIMGALEAQLLDADHIIITDVNDGSWCKPLEKNDFWMTQSMVKYFGMQSAETKNGFLRDIFARLAHKENVLITRSTLANGIQQQRYRHFDYIAKNLEITEAMAHARTRERKREAVKFEIPVPDVSLRPRSFWVSDLDLLQENPYAFYAKNILKLPQLNTIRELKNVRGNYIHSVLEKFVKCNEWTIDNFLLTAQKILRDKWMDIGDLGLWFFRLDKISDFVLSNLDATKCWTEISGATSVRIEEDYDITIRCRVDRIDEDNQGNISIIDYKSGIVPSIQSVKEGKKLQLPIALIVAQKGGFGLRQTTIKELCYWKLSGKDAGAEVISIAKNSEELQQVNSKALETLKDLVRKYNLKGEGYEVNANSFYEKSYLHLARIKEWDNAE